MSIVRGVLLLIIAAGVLAAAQSGSAPPAAEPSGQALQPTTPEGNAPVPGSQDAVNSTALEPVKTQRPVYPLAATQQRIQGEVWVEMLISETGEVEQAEVISGNPILAEAALAAGKKWKFKPYLHNGKPVKVQTKIPFDFYFGDRLSEAPTPPDIAGNAVGALPNATTPPPDSAADSSGAAPPKRVSVSQGVSEGLLLHKIAPVYPPEAKRQHVQGTVVLRAVIGKDGRLVDLEAVSGPPQLVEAAVGAVQQWRYKPYTLAGEPVEIQTMITVNFQLSR
jgi:TonB family protein